MLKSNGKDVLRFWGWGCCHQERNLVLRAVSAVKDLECDPCALCTAMPS